MDEQSLRVLEYERVRELLLAHASSELGKERVRAMVPLTDLREIEQRQAETAEACLAIEEQGGIPLGGIRDIRVAVDRAARDGILQPQELLPERSCLLVVHTAGHTEEPAAVQAEPAERVLEQVLPAVWKCLLRLPFRR